MKHFRELQLNYIQIHIILFKKTSLYKKNYVIAGWDLVIYCLTVLYCLYIIMFEMSQCLFQNHYKDGLINKALL